MVRRKSVDGNKSQSLLYDSHGRPVWVNMLCPKCNKTQPIESFGLRRMKDGSSRNQPYCGTCRWKLAKEKKNVVRSPVI